MGLREAHPRRARSVWKNQEEKSHEEDFSSFVSRCLRRYGCNCCPDRLRRFFRFYRRTTASGSTAGSAAGSAASGEVFELKLSTTQTDTSMIYQGLQAAADKVAEDTDGHVKVTIYPSSQLGGEEDMID